MHPKWYKKCTLNHSQFDKYRNNMHGKRKLINVNMSLGKGPGQYS